MAVAPVDRAGSAGESRRFRGEPERGGRRLSTAATVGVLREAIEQGWIISTRGPAGGYWRTDKAMVKSLDEALAALADQLAGTLRSIQVAQDAIARH